MSAATGEERIAQAAVSRTHDQAQLRGVFGQFATGVTVVTATTPTGAHGMTANSFTSVSLSPPLVLICVLRNAAMHRLILDYGCFAVSVLSSRQRALAAHFADRRRAEAEDEFRLIDWLPGPRTGVPLIRGALAWLECRLTAVYDGGDHSIFLAEVVDLGRTDADDALLFFGGNYRELERPVG